MDKLFIIDLMPFLYRGHFVFLKNPRMTSTGINTSALIGFVNSLVAILKDFTPTHVVLAMDPDGPTFRHEAYPPYKAQREKMPEDLAASIPYAFELAEALRIPILRMKGYEADDVMGTLAVKAAAAGFEVFLATPDKDAAQLVAPNIKLFRPGRNGDTPDIYDEARVREHWSLSSPKQMIDWLALAGDSSDNIPGIKGIGEKTASSLLSQYGTVEELIAHASELKGKVAEKIAGGAEDARMSKFLTTIRTDIPLDVSFDDFKRKEPDVEKLRAVCAKFELFSLSKRLLGESVAVTETVSYKTLDTVPHEYRLVTTLDEAAALSRELEVAPKFAFDTETTSTDARTARLVGMSFSTAKGKAWYVAVPTHRLPSETPQEAQDLFAAAQPVGEGHGAALAFVATFAAAFADPAKILVAQNAKFDMTVLSRYGIRFGSTVHDTMLEHYVLDAAAFHNMDYLAREYLGYDPIPITRLIGERKRGEQQGNMADLSPAEVCDYAAEDADVTLQLDEVLRPKVTAAGALQALVESEEPLAPILAEMEHVGVKIDTAALRAFGFEVEKEIMSLSAAIRSAAGDGDLNVDSPKQLGELLFGKMKLDPSAAKKTSKGQFSTDEKTLLKIIDAHPIVRQILDYRACAKLKSTYVDKLPLCIDPLDGRVHTTFAQALTETGRLSSSDPNLQNIPVRTERGKMIRAAIVPRDANHVLVSADYSQIELRIMAAMSGDEAMLDAFAHGADIHRETAARVYDVMPPLVTDDMRSKCKMVNFGIIYGISSFGLAQRLRVSRREAADLIDTYFRLYPKIRAFMDTAIARARDKGYAVTALGRRRTLRDISSRNATVRQAAERDAINTPIQGTAADLIKVAMVKVDRALKAEGLKAKMILQIHDELLFDTPCDEVERVKAVVKREMEGAMNLGVSLDVSVGAGRNWLEAH